MRKISAPKIHTVSGPVLHQAVIVFNNEGRIIDLIQKENLLYEIEDVEILEGEIIPGFVNVHCHLELSYLKEKIAAGTGLGTFIKELQQVRNQSTKACMLEAQKQADIEMWENGIVAVGDIKNSSDSIAVAGNSPIYYHHFVELFGFDPGFAREIFNKGLALKSELQEKGIAEKQISLVPHSPYSVSNVLLGLISSFAVQNQSILSIHNQESVEEHDLFSKGAGTLLERLKEWKIATAHFVPSGKSSIQSVGNALAEAKSTLLVHNTYSDISDISWILKEVKAPWFVICPAANIYIEGRLPALMNFPSDRICLGTDSLASNNKLSIWHEMQIIMKNFPNFTFTQVLKWATLHGAQALSIEGKYGSIEIGKQPGLLHLNPLTGKVNRI